MIIGLFIQFRSFQPFVDQAIPNEVQEPTDIAPGTLLYYNAPAAIQIGDTTAIGLIDNTGAIRVIKIEGSGAQTSIMVHQYDRPDDHGAPAIWAEGDKILLSTAWHSSDLFLYEIDGDGSVALLCSWQGKFSYPRFVERDGNLRLYVRIEDGIAGHLGYTEITQDCTEPAVLYRAPDAHWIYATADGDARWSIWDSVKGRHGELWAHGMRRGVPPTEYPEILAWSQAGPTITAVSFFKDAFKCCQTGDVEAQILDDGRPIYTTKTAAPYYPTGIVLKNDGAEFLTPTLGQITRRSFPEFSDLPSCIADGINANGQYVHGGEGSYVFVNWTGPYGQNDFGNARVLLCRP